MQKIRICDLVEDLSVYPRFQVDDQHVRALAEAIEAGCELPPVVVERKSKRIVDGFHRKRAYERVHGPDHKIEVALKTYPSEAELFLDAARLNSSHGRPMVACDYARTVQTARRLGVKDISIVARVLNITVKKLDGIVATRFARGTVDSIKAVPIKRTIQHMAGLDMTDEQVRANTKLSGQNQSFYANQLILLLETQMLDMSDDGLIERLRLLYELLEPVVGAAAQ